MADARFNGLQINQLLVNITKLSMPISGIHHRKIPIQQRNFAIAVNNGNRSDKGAPEI